MPYKTIALSEKTKENLDKLKIHHRETYEDVIKRLIKDADNKI
jgi:predicted CopG family antitoxin